MNDRDWLLAVLSDGMPHTHAEILRRSDLERGHGLTVHSRAADLRKPEHGGHDIQVTVWRDGNGRSHSSYRLVSPSSQSTTAGEADPLVSHSGSVGVDCVDGGQASLFQIPASARGAYSEAA